MIAVLAGAIGGLLALAGAYLNQRMGTQADTRRRRAALAALIFAKCDQLERTTMMLRIDREHGDTPSHRESGLDDILETINVAAYELMVISEREIEQSLRRLQTINERLVFSTVPALEREDDVRELRHESRLLRDTLRARISARSSSGNGALAAAPSGIYQPVIRRGR